MEAAEGWLGLGDHLAANEELEQITVALRAHPKVLMVRWQIYAKAKKAPQFVAEPQDTRITEGESARFTAKAEGVPIPNYQWFSADRANNGQVSPGETNPKRARIYFTLRVLNR